MRLTLLNFYFVVGTDCTQSQLRNRRLEVVFSSLMD